MSGTSSPARAASPLPPGSPGSTGSAGDVADETERFVLKNIVVHVATHERRHGPDGDFVAFKVESAIRPGLEAKAEQAGATGSLHNGPWVVWRRFNNFELLRQFLCYKYPATIVPPIPEKTLNFKMAKLGVDKFDPQFVEKRRIGFDRFLKRLLVHPTLSTAPIVLRFLQNQNWRQFLTVNVDGLEQKWTGQTSINNALKKISGKPQHPNKTFLDEKSYNAALRDDIAAILNIHIRLATAIHLLHGELNDFGDGLSNLVELGSGRTVPLFDMIGQQFDSMTGTGPELLKREEICFADRLKEYALFADAAKDLLENQERVQIKYERAQAACEGKRKSIANWKNPEGFSGFFKGLASKDTQSQSIAKEEAELDNLLKNEVAAELERSGYNQLVTEELERFRDDRTKGIKAVLLEYARIQQQYCRKNLAYWTDVKAACDDVEGAGGMEPTAPIGGFN